MTRGQRWHSLQGRKSIRSRGLLAAHCSQPFPFAYWASARVSTAGRIWLLCFCSVSGIEPTANDGPSALLCCTSSLSFFYDLPTAEVQVSFTLETNRHQHT